MGGSGGISFPPDRTGSTSSNFLRRDHHESVPRGYPTISAHQREIRNGIHQCGQSADRWHPRGPGDELCFVDRTGGRCAGERKQASPDRRYVRFDQCKFGCLDGICYAGCEWFRGDRDGLCG